MKKRVFFGVFMLVILSTVFSSFAAATNCYSNHYPPYHSTQHYYPTNYHYVDTIHLSPYIYPHYNPHFIYEPIYSYRSYFNPWRFWW